MPCYGRAGLTVGESAHAKTRGEKSAARSAATAARWLVPHIRLGGPPWSARRPVGRLRAGQTRTCLAGRGERRSGEPRPRGSVPRDERLAVGSAALLLVTFPPGAHAPLLSTPAAPTVDTPATAGLPPLRLPPPAALVAFSKLGTPHLPPAAAGGMATRSPELPAAAAAAANAVAPTALADQPHTDRSATVGVPAAGIAAAGVGHRRWSGPPHPSASWCPWTAVVRAGLSPWTLQVVAQHHPVARTTMCDVRADPFWVATVPPLPPPPPPRCPAGRRHVCAAARAHRHGRADKRVLPAAIGERTGRSASAAARRRPRPPSACG